MTEKERRKGGGSKLSRSETVTVRLDPKLRYLAELAARKQRRTLSSFIEWAIEDTLNRVILQYDGPDSKSVADVATRLWDVDEADRFVRLAFDYPDLLTHDEQILWKLITENGFLWKGHYTEEGWIWQVQEIYLIIHRLREHWGSFVEVGRGQQTKDILPSWNNVKPSPAHADDDFIPEEDVPL